MFAETEGHSPRLGKEAKAFLEWSEETGRMLAALPHKVKREIPSIVNTWRVNKPFGDTPMEILALYDGPPRNKKTVQYALLNTTRGTETFIQFLPRHQSLMPKPYASILQVAPDGQAVSLSMGRTDHDTPDHVALRLGKVARYPQRIGLSSESEPAAFFKRPRISVYTDGRIVHTSPWPIDQAALILHVSGIIAEIFRGKRVVVGKHARYLRF